jgi:hypothetical protein
MPDDPVIDADVRRLLALFARQEAALELVTEATEALRTSHLQLGAVVADLAKRLNPPPTGTNRPAPRPK